MRDTIPLMSANGMSMQMGDPVISRPKIGRGLTIGKCWSVRTITTILFIMPMIPTKSSPGRDTTRLHRRAMCKTILKITTRIIPFCSCFHGDHRTRLTKLRPKNIARCIAPRMCLCARMCHQNPKRMPENGLWDTTPIVLRWTIVWAICSKRWMIRV